MSFDISQDYFDWLCELIHADQIDRSWWLLMKDLYKMPFYSRVQHDDNREGDGLELREEYERDCPYFEYAEYLGDKDCSVLEMLIALARRINYELIDPYDEMDEKVDRTAYWFWEMIDNLGLMMFDDESYVEYGGFKHVDEIVYRLLEREYDYDGEGGLFPLDNPHEDQRDVEIWYQACAYLAERNIA